MLRCLALALACLAAAPTHADTCSKEFATAEAFEAEVMDDDKVWAIVFHSAKKGTLSRQRCLLALPLLPPLAHQMTLLLLPTAACSSCCCSRVFRLSG